METYAQSDARPAINACGRGALLCLGHELLKSYKDTRPKRVTARAHGAVFGTRLRVACQNEVMYPRSSGVGEVMYQTWFYYSVDMPGTNDGVPLKLVLKLAIRVRRQLDGNKYVWSIE